MTKTRVFLRIIAGGYLAYTGGGLVKDVLADQPENYVLYAIIGAIFAVLGAWWCVKGLIAAVRHEYTEPEDE